MPQPRPVPLGFLCRWATLCRLELWPVGPSPDLVPPLHCLASLAIPHSHTSRLFARHRISPHSVMAPKAPAKAPAKSPKAAAPPADKGGKKDDAAPEPTAAVTTAATTAPKNKEEVLAQVNLDGLPHCPNDQILEILREKYDTLVAVFIHYCKQSECKTLEQATRLRLGACARFCQNTDSWPLLDSYAACGHACHVTPTSKTINRAARSVEERATGGRASVFGAWHGPCGCRLRSRFPWSSSITPPSSFRRSHRLFSFIPTCLADPPVRLPCAAPSQPASRSS